MNENMQQKKHPVLLAIFLVLAVASIVAGLILFLSTRGELKEVTNEIAALEEKGAEVSDELYDKMAGLKGKNSVGIALLPLSAFFILGGVLLYGAKRAFTVKTIVSIAIGSALFFVLGRFAAIPSGVPNTNIAVQYGVLAFIAGVFGPIAGTLTGLIGHFFIDLSFGWGVWWSWVITSAFFGLAMGVLAKLMKVDKDFKGIKIATFNGAQVLVNLLSWAVIAPILDIVIYQEDAQKVFTQGIVSAGINILATAVVGTILFLAWSASQPKKGSLKVEEDAPETHKE